MTITNRKNIKQKYDLEERTFEFAKNVRLLVKELPKSIANKEDIRQVIKSSGSVGANYIEANEALSKKDFLWRVKISRKEAKESHYWLKIINQTNDLETESTINNLIQESSELTKIFSAIIEKSK